MSHLKTATGFQALNTFFLYFYYFNFGNIILLIVTILLYTLESWLCEIGFQQMNWLGVKIWLKPMCLEIGL